MLKIYLKVFNLKNIYDNIVGSDNGLVPDSTKPLPEPMLTLHIISKVPWHLFDTIIIRRPEDCNQ